MGAKKHVENHAESPVTKNMPRKVSPAESVTKNMPRMMSPGETVTKNMPRMMSAIEVACWVATMSALVATPALSHLSMYSGALAERCYSISCIGLDVALMLVPDELRVLVTTTIGLITEYWPTNAVQFRALFCIWVAFALLRFHPAQARFYRWFSQSDISPATKRGFGYFCCNCFGIFPMPSLTPLQLTACCLSCAACLLTAAMPINCPWLTRCCLAAALVLSQLYFSQLHCESRAGGHASIIVPLVLIHLIFASDDSTWVILAVKAHVACCYFSASLGKFIVSIYFGKFWGDGRPMQFMFWEAMWMRPGGPISQVLQPFIFKRLWLCSLMSLGALAFQILHPLSLLDIRLSWLFFFASFKFHVSILITSNISFLPYWVPALMVFLFPHGASPWDGAWESAAFAVSSTMEQNPISFYVSATYLFLQAVATFTLVDLTYGDVLPLSCEPMFVLPRNIYDEWPKLMVLTGADCGEAGHFEPYFYGSFNPISKVWPMDEKAMLDLPAPTVIFVTLKGRPKEIEDFIIDGATKSFYVWGNVDVSEPFFKVLSEIAGILNTTAERTSDMATFEQLAQLQSEATGMFNEACLLPRKSFGFDDDNTCNTMNTALLQAGRN